jgi:hypothetical protein
MKLDKETREELQVGEKLSRLVDSQDWVQAKLLLNDLILEVSNILQIEERDPILLMQEVASRQLAVSLVRAWIDQVEGGAFAHQMNKQSLENQSKNDLYFKV